MCVGFVELVLCSRGANLLVSEMEACKTGLMVAKELGCKNIILLEVNKELMEELKIQDAENFSLYSYAVANKIFIFDSVL